MDVPEVIEEFFGVYLLYCLNPKLLGKTYIGYTTDPNRRIKQHNKGSWAGGARRTNNRGPWKMILITHGFPNNIAALRFEWAWQNPSNSRRLHHVVHKKRQAKKETQLEYCLRILSEMLRVGPWNRLPLCIRWLAQDYVQEFKPDKLPPIHMPICHGPVKSKKIRKNKNNSIAKMAKTEHAIFEQETEDLNLEYNRQGTSTENCQNYKITSKSPTKKKKNELKTHSQKQAGKINFLSQSNLNGTVLCKLCMKLITAEESKLTCLNLKCDLVSHLQCLAELFLESGEYVPVEGDCPFCGQRMLWGHLIRKMKGCNDLRDEPKSDDDDDESLASNEESEIEDLHNTTGSDICLDLSDSY